MDLIKLLYKNKKDSLSSALIVLLINPNNLFDLFTWTINYLSFFSYGVVVLSCQPRLTVTSCCVLQSYQGLRIDRSLVY